MENFLFIAHFKSEVAVEVVQKQAKFSQGFGSSLDPICEAEAAFYTFSRK